MVEPDLCTSFGTCIGMYVDGNKNINIYLFSILRSPYVPRQVHEYLCTQALPMQAAFWQLLAFIRQLVPRPVSAVLGRLILLIAL